MRVEHKDTASAMLTKLAARVGDLSPLMQAMGRHMMVSVRTNFAVGGRPTWAPLKNVIVLERGKKKRKGQRRQGDARMGGPLVKTGNLRNSIAFTAERADLKVWAFPSPGVKGPVHQWGVPDTTHGGSGRLAGKHHNVMIPARPFLVFQREDLDWFRKSAIGWIRAGRVPA